MPRSFHLRGSAARAAREDVDNDEQRAVREGESASNGLAERSVRSIEEQTRTFLAATEARIRMPIPSDHPLLAWIVEHATYVLNHFLIGPDGQTPYSRLQGKNSSKKLCKFGEKVRWVRS